MRCADLVTTLLRNPEAAHDYSARDWTLAIRQARGAEVMGQIYARMQARDLLGTVPKPALRHLEGLWQISLRQHEALRWELRCIADALRSLDIPVVLLKGAAYSAAGLSASQGRLFSDVDILVPKESLLAVEKAFFRHGWMTTHLNAYDQRYYRKWMHELPPLEHIRRGTLIDVHHTLLPPTTGVRCDASALIALSQPLDKPELLEFRVLAPSDMLLHSATHLFYGEFDRSLRELADLDQLIREVASTPHFWSTTIDRAGQLGLLGPLHHAVRYTHKLLGTPVPESVLGRSLDPTIGTARQHMLDALFLRAFRPNHDSCNDAGARLARLMAYIRSHWLRMPIHLLVPHLLYKSLIAPRKNKQGA